MWVYAKKIFSIVLIFNALLTIVYAVGILSGFYQAFPYWQPFSPFLLNGNIFWLIIVGALINIFPSARIGRALHTGRLWFHHYVYGFFAMVVSAVYVTFFTSVSLSNLFLVDTTSVPVNAGRCVLLGGLTLFLDDLPDVHTRIDSACNWLKFKAYQGRKLIYAVHLIIGIITFYLFLAVLFWTIQNTFVTLANTILLGTTLVTSVTHFAFIRRKTWLKLTPTC